MKIVFISSVAAITQEPKESRKLYVDLIGLPLTQHAGSDYYFSEKIEGSKHFGVWPLSEAAQACFGQREWPKDVLIPQSSIEFEVASEMEVQSAAEELLASGYKLLHETRTEPWGQTVVRTLSPEGLILGISYAPWLHKS